MVATKNRTAEGVELIYDVVKVELISRIFLEISPVFSALFCLKPAQRPIKNHTNVLGPAR